MRLIANAISIETAKFHCNRLTRYSRLRESHCLAHILARSYGTEARLLSYQNNKKVIVILIGVTSNDLERP